MKWRRRIKQYLSSYKLQCQLQARRHGGVRAQQGLALKWNNSMKWLIYNCLFIFALFRNKIRESYEPGNTSCPLHNYHLLSTLPGYRVLRSGGHGGRPPRTAVCRPPGPDGGRLYLGGPAGARTDHGLLGRTGNKEWGKSGNKLLHRM